MLEYGSETFVYDRRRPFDVDRLNAFVQSWPDSIVRAKGTLWAAQDPDMCYLFEQAGRQTSLTENGLFVDSAPIEERECIIAENPELKDDWDPEVGDRQTKICFIGRHMDRDALFECLDACLTDWSGRR